MAGEQRQQQQPQPSFDDTDDLAFRIYAHRVAARPVRRNGEAEALLAYRQAESFLAARKRVKAGELNRRAPEGPQLADCYCPNQPRVHPHNLVSQHWGSLEKVNRVHRWLEANPDTDAEFYFERLRNEFPELHQWGEPEVNIARAVFPAYVTTK